MARSPRRIPSLILALGLLLTIAAPREAPAQRGGLRDKFLAQYMGQKAPDFLLEALDGPPLRLSDFRGRTVLLNFWFSKCPPCRREIPDLVVLQRIYEKKGLVILGINLDDVIIPASEGLELQRFLQDIEVPYPILRGDQKVFEAYGQVPAQPTSFLIDREGTIVEIFWGARPAKVFEQAIRPLLSDGKVAHP